MFTVVHATAGIIVGKYSHNFIFGLIFGLISHYLLDVIPHGDEKLIDDREAFRQNFHLSRKQKICFFFIALADLLIAIIIASILYYQQIIDINPAMMGAILGSIFPDLIFGAFLATRMPGLKKINQPHVWFHTLIKNEVTLKQGLAIQFGFLLLFIAIIMIF